MAVIPQKSDTKWPNQFIANAAKSSGECSKTHTGRRRGGRERKMTVIHPVVSKTEEL